MSADKNQPIPIFLGASLALVLVTFLGVFLENIYQNSSPNIL